MSTQSFAVGERVLCYHGPLIYESKILKGEVWDEANTKLETVGPHYLVHYKGWKQTCVTTHIPLFLVFLNFFLAVGTNGSPPRASSNSTRPTFPFRRTSPGRKLLPQRPVPLPPKHRTRLAVHNPEEGDVRRAGAARKGAGTTTTGLEGPRCGWSYQTH